jgi:murein L,D-transpeptidase YcbB/YkuD
MGATIETDVTTMSRALLVFFGTLCGTFSGVQAQDTMPADLAAEALQEQIQALIQPEDVSIRGAHIAWVERIHEFYAARSFQPAWTDANVSRELLRAIRDSHLDGLEPGDYHLSLLQQLSEEVAAPTADASVRAQFDLLQTDALLRLGYHLSFGKVDPESFDAQWNYGRTLAKLDVAKWLEEVFAAKDIYARIEALKPVHRFYVALKGELQRYRAAAAAGSLAALPQGSTLIAGMSDARVPMLRNRLIASGDLVAPGALAAPELYDAAVEEGVRRFQERMGLAVDGAVGARTRQELNIPLTDRISQLRVNLDRGRVLLHDLPPQFVVVNIAAYWVYVVRNDEVIWNSRVQVGTPYRRTLIFRSAITYLVWNPTWTVPPGIIRRDILPNARRDPRSITRRGLAVLDRKGKVVDPATIDWSQYRSGHIPYTLRQAPGPDNAMGRVKFMFPNSYAVYLHDTPSKARFDAPDRLFSSGCVRVERPFELAMLLLNDPERWNETTIARTIASGRTQNVTLRNEVPVLLAYLTAWQDAAGRMNFRRDVYGQDAQWATGLDAPFKIRRRPLTAVTSGRQQSRK